MTNKIYVEDLKGTLLPLEGDLKTEETPDYDNEGDIVGFWIKEGKYILDLGDYADLLKVTKEGLIEIPYYVSHYQGTDVDYIDESINTQIFCIEGEEYIIPAEINKIQKRNKD